MAVMIGARKAVAEQNLKWRSASLLWLLILALFPLAYLSYYSLHDVEFMIRADCAGSYIYYLPEKMPFVSLEECTATHWARQDRRYAR